MDHFGSWLWCSCLVVLGFGLGWSAHVCPACDCEQIKSQNEHTQQQTQSQPQPQPHHLFQQHTLQQAESFSLAHHTRHRVRPRFSVEDLRGAGQTFAAKSKWFCDNDDINSNHQGLDWLCHIYAQASCLENPNSRASWEALSHAAVRIGNTQAALKAFGVANELKLPKGRPSPSVPVHVERMKKAVTEIVWNRALEEFAEFTNDLQGQAIHPLSLDKWWLHFEPSHNPVGAGDGVLTHLFTTPVMIFRNFLTASQNAATNTRLAEFALAAFSSFMHTHDDLTVEEANNMFFDWQMEKLEGREEDEFSVPEALTAGTGWAALSQLQEYKYVHTRIIDALAAFLKRTGAETTDLPQENCGINRKTPCLYSWFSVHASNSSHNVHVHGDSLLSAVYYVSVPEGSGDIVFLDPRGHPPLHELQDNIPHPPFIGTYRHKPQPGDLIVFPSWLPHGVLPSNTKTGHRISIAFNLVGGWFGVHNTRIQAGQ